MSELPAMSVHVQELLAMTSGKRSANYDDLAKIILNDFSLTHKVLQYANSAYYSLGQKVSTVSMAVAVLGFDTVRDLAIGIALYDDFVQAGVDAGQIGEILTRSFLAAMLSRRIAESRYLKVLPEEAFICGLMRNLGKIIACIYLPTVYIAIEDKVKKGGDEEQACRSILDGLSYADLGREVAIFWNMTENVIKTMEVDPPLAEEESEVETYLHNIVDFSNRYVDCLWFLKSTTELIEKYGFTLDLDDEETVDILQETSTSGKAIFESIRPGIEQLDFQKRLNEIQELEEVVSSSSSAKSIKDYWEEINALLKSDFRLNDFFSFLIDALYKGIGFDRVLLLMLRIDDENRKMLAGKLGVGDVSPADIKSFKVSLADSRVSLVESFVMRRDLALADGTKAVFPDHLQSLVEDRVLYLFPVSMRNKGVALIYLDRKKGKAKLDALQIKYVKKFRDLAEKAIMLKRKKE